MSQNCQGNAKTVIFNRSWKQAGLWITGLFSPRNVGQMFVEFFYARWQTVSLQWQESLCGWQQLRLCQSGTWFHFHRVSLYLCGNTTVCSCYLQFSLEHLRGKSGLFLFPSVWCLSVKFYYFLLIATQIRICPLVFWMHACWENVFTPACASSAYLLLLKDLMRSCLCLTSLDLSYE